MAKYEMVKVFDLGLAPPDVQAVDDLQTLKSFDVSTRLLLEVRVGQNTISDKDHAIPSLDRWMLAEGAQVGETVFLVWSATTIVGIAAAMA